MRLLLLAISVTLLATTSLGVKISAALHSSQHKAEPSTSLPHLLTAQLDKHGYQPDYTHPMTNSDLYIARIFQSANCDGRVAGLALRRNAEGAHLLNAILQEANPTITFIVNNQRYETFPEIRFAWLRFTQNLSLVLDTTSPPVSAQAWAVATTGNCELFTPDELTDRSPGNGKTA